MRIFSQKVFLLSTVFFTLSACSSSGSNYDAMELFAPIPVTTPAEVKPSEKQTQNKPTKPVLEKTTDKKEKPAPSPKSEKEPVQAVEEKIEAPVKADIPAVKEQKTVKADPLKALNVSNIYKVEWVNMTVAYFVAEVKTNGSDVSFKFHSESMGLVDKLVNFGWSSLTEAKFDGNNYKPVSVNRMSEMKKRARKITLEYDAKGNITKDVVTPPENRAKRPEVEQSEKNGTYDALTLFLQARSEVIDIFKDRKFTNGEAKVSLPIYDGRKKSIMDLTVYEVVTDNKFKVRVRQKPVAGYTNNELKDAAKGDRFIDVLVDSRSYIPVRATGKSPLGSAKASYEKECTASFEDCIRQITKK
jgi:hypothetical protein